MEEAPTAIDYENHPALPVDKTISAINRFIIESASFLNRFASLCEQELSGVDERLRRLSGKLQILEARLQSVPVEITGATGPAVSIPASGSAAPAGSVQPPPGFDGGAPAAPSGVPPPPSAGGSIPPPPSGIPPPPSAGGNIPPPPAPGGSFPPPPSGGSMPPPPTGDPPVEDDDEDDEELEAFKAEWAGQIKSIKMKVPPDAVRNRLSAAGIDTETIERIISIGQSMQSH